MLFFATLNAVSKLINGWIVELNVLTNFIACLRVLNLWIWVFHILSIFRRESLNRQDHSILSRIDDLLRFVLIFTYVNSRQARNTHRSDHWSAPLFMFLLPAENSCMRMRNKIKTNRDKSSIRDSMLYLYLYYLHIFTVIYLFIKCWLKFNFFWHLPDKRDWTDWIVRLFSYSSLCKFCS